MTPAEYLAQRTAMVARHRNELRQFDAACGVARKGRGAKAIVVEAAQSAELVADRRRVIERNSELSALIGRSESINFDALLDDPTDE